ncbi:probable cytochrome P450 4s3 [Condylostylus longicornis]|uniref:probable cytochrome P450 4s3 n=1 Tax=Condylostylus longicornis TaxID=2530218 RepID=UPI00244E0CF7|nr:probable cytochrome P450 4s3 [Condylostylus longicornis]
MNYIQFAIDTILEYQYLIVTFVGLFIIWQLIKLLPAYKEFMEIYRFSKTVPGPTVREFLKNAKRERVLPWIEELRKEHGRMFGIWFGTHYTVFLTDPDLVRQLLSNNHLLYKSHNYEITRPWLGNGLLTNGGPTWHQRRKMLTPAFHFKILSLFKQPMEDNCDILIRKLNEKAITGEEFDVYPYITLFAMDVICETAMGIKKHAQMNSDSEYVKAVQMVCRALHKQSFSFWYRFSFIFNRSEVRQERDKALEILHKETRQTIAVRRKLLEKEHILNGTNGTVPNGNSTEDTLGVKRRMAFLDMLLISQKEGMPINDEEIREEVDTFMFEGHDTTSSAIAFTLYLLSLHSDVQQKVYEEIQNFEGRENETMKYLEAVLKESMRLYPPVPFFSRIVHDKFILDNIIEIPKGVTVSSNAFLVHRNPKYFPDPYKFDPERFLNTEKEMHPYAFVAFSAGPRNCIGQKFAMLELKCTISKLVREFEILPAKDSKPILLAELIMKSDNGIRIRLKKR